MKKGPVVVLIAALAGLAAPAHARGPVLVRTHDDAQMFVGIFFHPPIGLPDVHFDVFGDGNWVTEISMWGDQRHAVLPGPPPIPAPDQAVIVVNGLAHAFAPHREAPGPDFGVTAVHLRADFGWPPKAVSKVEKAKKPHGDHEDAVTLGLAGLSRRQEFDVYLAVATAAHTTGQWFVCSDQAPLEGGRETSGGLVAVLVNGESGALVVAAGVPADDMKPDAVTVAVGGALVATSAGDDVQPAAGLGAAVLMRRKLAAEGVAALQKSGAVVTVSTSAGPLRATVCTAPAAGSR